MTSAGHPILAAEAEAFRLQFEQLSAEAENLASPLSEDDFHNRPTSDVWSIAECLEHLNVTARLYLPALDEGIGVAIRGGLYGEGPFKYNWVGRLAVASMEPPPRFRMKTMKALEPGTRRPANEVLAGFRAYQVQLIDRLHQATGLDFARARVRSPVAAWLRLPLGSGFALIAAHERRHLWQARRAVESRTTT